MDFQIIPDSHGMGAMVLTKNTDIGTDIYLSLAIPYGSWFQNPTFGSSLFQIKKVTASNILLARQYVQKALQWLIQTGKALTIDVVVEADSLDRNRIDIKVTAKQTNGVELFYQQYLDVRAGTLVYQPVGGPESTYVTP